MHITPRLGFTPVQSPNASALFLLTASLPSIATYTRNDTVATARNASGKLATFTANTPRFDHDVLGNNLGILVEGSRSNKITIYNASPTDITGVTAASGTPVISIVTDATSLTAAGLDQIGNGNVIKIDNSGQGTNCDIDFSGTTGNVNPHSFSVWARETQNVMTRLKRSGSGSNTVTIAGATYTRYKLENETPSATTNTMRITVNAGGIVYCLLHQVEETTFCSSEIVTSGASATRAADSVTLTTTGQLWFDQAQGFIAVRYRPLVTKKSVDQYIAVLHDGSTANTVGVRIDATTAALKGFVKGASVNLHSTSNGVLHPPAGLAAAGVTWKDGTSTILYGGVANTQSYTGNPTGLTTLAIGHRNGAADPVWGHVESVEVGKTYLSVAALSRKMFRNNDVLATSGGQSLMAGHFISQASSSAGGRDTFNTTGEAVRLLNTTAFVNGATGGSAASKTTDAVNYWWDLSTSSRGPALDTFYTATAASGIAPNAILWAQGEADCHQIGIATSRAQYKQALQAIFADMRTTYGNIPVVIQSIGRRATFSNTGGIQAVREVQEELATENSWVHLAAETYSQGLFDDVHLDDAGYVFASERNARKLLSVLGDSVSGVTGVKMTGATRSGTTVTVTLLHDAGTDFTPTTAIEGFKFFDNTTEISITAAVRTNVTTITLTLASTPTGTQTLYYGYDAMLSLNPANTVRDNAAVPMALRTGKIVL